MLKTLQNDPSEWVIFENTHDAIIDQETFDIVQRIRKGRRRRTPMGDMPILSGMLFCADCGAKLYQVRHQGWTHKQEHFVCATYRKIKGGCTSHQSHNVQVEEILLRELRFIREFAKEHEDEFVKLAVSQNEKELNRLLRDSRKELDQARQRTEKLDTIIQKLYEDNVEGKKLNVDSFLKLVRNSTDITELTPEIIRTFVERIEVFQSEKVPDTRTKKQTICIHWNYIGAVEIHEKYRKTA